MIRWWEHSQKGVTDRQTDWTIHRAAWSQLKIIACKFFTTMTLHVVQIWLPNWTAELPWNHNNNTELQMSCLEDIVCNRQFVTNWYDLIEMPFYSTKWRCRLRYRRRWCHILAFIEEIRLHLSHKSWHEVLYAIRLTYNQDRWGVIGPVIHEESKSQATRGSSDHVGPSWIYFTHYQQSTLKSQNLGCVLYWSEKIWAGNSKRVGVRLVLEVCLILERRWSVELAKFVLSALETMFY